MCVCVWMGILRTFFSLKIKHLSCAKNIFFFSLELNIFIIYMKHFSLLLYSVSNFNCMKIFLSKMKFCAIDPLCKTMNDSDSPALRLVLAVLLRTRAFYYFSRPCTDAHSPVAHTTSNTANSTGLKLQNIVGGKPLFLNVIE